MNHKKTLILLPGLMSDSTVWKHQVTHLQDICNIIVPDFSSCHLLSEVLHVILNNAPKHFMLAGHSMGGWIALEIMRVNANRVSKLCLIDTSAEIDSTEKRKYRLQMIEQARLGKTEQVIDNLVQGFVYQTHAKLAVKKMFLKNHDAFIRQEEMMLKRETCIHFLPKLVLSPLLLVGKKDNNFYQSMLNIQHALSRSKLALVEDSGHMPTMEVPQAVTALMRLWIEYL